MTRSLTRGRMLTGLALLAGVACDSATRRISVASLAVTSTGQSLLVGASMQLSAAALDANGAPLAGRPIAWQSNPTTLATVSSAGLVSAHAVGSVVITASSEGRSAAITIAVILPPVATVTVSPAVDTLVNGTMAPLTVVLRDVAGVALVGRVVTWSTLNAAVANVNASGLVTATGLGNTTIIATSEGQQGTSNILVVATAPPPVIGSVSPATLVPGATATINGSGFAAIAGENIVTIRGVPASVLSVSPTSLDLLVPCVQSGTVSIVVSASGSSGAQRSHPLLAVQRVLGVGESVILTDHVSSLCNELVTTGSRARYLLTVFSAATSQNTLTDLELGGNGPAPAALTAEMFAPPAITAPRRTVPQLVGTAIDRARDADHWEMLERNRADYERLRAIPVPRDAAARIASDPVPELGAMRTLYYVRGTSCSDSTNIIRGKAIRVGTRSIIWEDSANVLQSASNGDLAGYFNRLGQIFDQEQYESVRANYGDPLLRDAVTDADGMVHMVFTQRLVGSGAVAYVTSCDQFPRSSSPGSNFGQFFYGLVPTLAGSNLGSTSAADGWFYFMARTIVHEVKHIASHSARVANGAPSYEQSWLEEGTARHAEELWVRESLHRVPWKANTGYGTAASGGIYCDFHPADLTCNAADPLRRPSYGMRRQFNEIREKLLAPWNWSPYGDATGQSGSVFYQTTWSLVRYAIDRFGASDASFLTALNSATVNGITNLSAVAGVPMDRLIGGWGLALYADDYPGLSASALDLQFPTWDMRSIYAGLNAAPSWTSRWSTPFPILPLALPYGAFTTLQLGVRGGSHVYYEFAGAVSGTQLLHLRAPGGGTASPNLRIAIARLP